MYLFIQIYDNFYIIVFLWKFNYKQSDMLPYLHKYNAHSVFERGKQNNLIYDVCKTH